MTKPEIPTITKEELKHVLIVGCNLHSWFGAGDEGIRKLIRTHGFVQLDPLNPAGRYHDYFFSARLSDYTIRQFERLAYSNERLVFETYFHNLNAIAMDHFPFFNSYTGKEHLGRYYSRLLHNLEELGGSKLLDEVYEHIKTHGPIKSADLAKLGKADPKYASWKSSRNSGIALELLWGLGQLVIVERDNYSEEERQLYRLKLKLDSFPVIPIGKLTVNTEGKVASSKKQGFSLKALMKIDSETEKIFPLVVRMDDDSGYIIPSNWKELCQLSLDEEMRVIGPLDPVIWDRDLLKHLFGFDYVWEVYKKVQDRVWGYYVYPLLYKGDFIGRLEAKYVKKTKHLEVFSFRKEKGFKLDKIAVSASKRLFQRWKEMVDAHEMKFDSTIPIQMTIE